MERLLGNYKEDLAKSAALLSLVLYPENVTLRWPHCSMAADFCAGYLASSWRQVGQKQDFCREIRGAVGYVGNELLENAMKFHKDGLISIAIHGDRREMAIVVSNWVEAKEVEAFQRLIHEVTSADPTELLVRKMEDNAEHVRKRVSGIGYLSIMSDYRAVLGWCFEPVAPQSPYVAVKTMAIFRLEG